MHIYICILTHIHTHIHISNISSLYYKANSKIWIDFMFSHPAILFQTFLSELILMYVYCIMRNFHNI